ncbi:septum site-determining protein MinC [Desulfatiferula olefinivorans]
MTIDADRHPIKTVKLRGSRDGFTLLLDSDQPYDIIENQTEALFVNLRRLARGASVAVDGGTSDTPQDLIERLGSFLKDRFGVRDVFRKIIIEKQAGPDAMTENGVAPDEEDMGDVKVMAGRVRSGQRVDAAHHLIILGDVNPGGEVTAGGDILILGSLCGTAIAGQSTGEKAIILALDFRPTQVQIAARVAAGMAASPGKKIEYAYVENGAIVVDNYLTANPFGKLPVLEER